MLKLVIRFGLIAGALLVLVSVALAQGNLASKAGSLQPQPAENAESDRGRDGLIGPVRRVRTEIAKLIVKDGRMVESKRALLEVVSYDLKGKKVENQYFPVEGATLTGKEVYKYDDKGNISEMTLLDGDGSLMSKELYKYDYDFAGNWTRMTTSVAVVDGGRVSFEPAEVTYRSIMYYLDDNLAKLMQNSAGQPPSPPAVAANNVAKTSLESQPGAGQPAKDPESKHVAPPLPAVNSSSRLNEVSSATDAKPSAANPGSTDAQVVMESEPPPSPGPKPILKPVSGGVLNGTAISLPTPGYPETAKRMRISGVVAVDVVVDETGRVISAKATSGPAALRNNAEQAALKARFSPTKLSGQPVKVSGTINYKFSLGQ